MLKFLSMLIAMLIITSSQANTLVNKNDYSGRTTIIEAPRRTVTPKGSGHVSSIRIPKPKLFVGNPHKASLFAENNDDDFLEVDDIITAYRRRDLHTVKTESTPDNPEGLSDRVRWRLFLARQLAMLRYYEIHGSKRA